MTAVSTDWLDRVVERALPAARVVQAASATGGISGDTRFARVRLADGEEVELVAKRPGAKFGRVDALRLECEFRVLEAVTAVGLPTPRPVYLSLEEGALLMGRLPGSAVFDPPDAVATAHAMADLSAAVHLAFCWPGGELLLGPAMMAGLSQVVRSRESISAPARVTDESLGEARIRGALAPAWPPPSNPPTLLHGDLWPGNLLWVNEVITGLIDWEDASLGDPLEDVSITRLDTWWQFGEDAMHAFTERYFSQVPWSAASLPVFDLLAALRPCGYIADWAHGLDDVPATKPHITEEHMRAVHAEFAQQALAAL